MKKRIVGWVVLSALLVTGCGTAAASASTSASVPASTSTSATVPAAASASTSSGAASTGDSTTGSGVVAASNENVQETSLHLKPGAACCGLIPASTFASFLEKLPGVTKVEAAPAAASSATDDVNLSIWYNAAATNPNVISNEVLQASGYVVTK
jgi:hypothetical protein